MAKAHRSRKRQIICINLGSVRKNRAALGIMGKMLIKGIRVYRIVERAEKANVGKSEAARSGK